jgi:hypothetical protein
MREANPQLSLYGAAGLETFGLAADFKRVRTVIIQPRLNHVSERVQTVEEIAEFVTEVQAATVAANQPSAPLVTSTKGCKFCKAKANCKALRDEALEAFNSVSEPTAAADDALATAMAKADLIEGWLKSVRAEVERRLLSGTAVPGYKLVQGKRGHRKWSNAEEAETILKTMRVPHDRMYDYSLVTPTTVEKLFKEGVVGPRQWPKLQPLITQSEGGPSVAPETDKRTAMVVTSASASDFDDVTNLS